MLRVSDRVGSTQGLRFVVMCRIAFRLSVQRRHPGVNNFAAQWLACRFPLSTLRLPPRDDKRMTRGQDDSPLPSRIGLSPTTTCQFVLAHTDLLFAIEMLS